LHVWLCLAWLWPLALWFCSFLDFDRFWRVWLFWLDLTWLASSGIRVYDLRFTFTIYGLWFTFTAYGLWFTVYYTWFDLTLDWSWLDWALSGLTLMFGFDFARRLTLA
jgi:hypothetical protein